MSYNPYTAVNRIYNLKGQWEYGNNSGDDNLKNEAAAKAKTYYQELIDNDYKDIADKLTAADYTQAKSIRDGILTSGKSKTRDYFYSLGKSKGLSSADIDKLIEWNGETGEVSFGGKKIGRPDVVTDGTSYWSDTSVLDNAFNDYIQRSGTTNNSVLNKNNKLWALQNKDHSDLTGLYKKEYEDLKNINPYTTDEAKTILAKYDLAGLQGRDNAAARGAGSNGGNIDSFAAANAMRQQAALINQGQQMVLDSYNRKLNHAKSLLDGLGVQMRENYTGMKDTISTQQAEEQRQFNNEVAKAEISGIIPDEWVVSNNPYMNNDGTIKAGYENKDFSDAMAAAEAAGDKTAYDAAATARFYKIMGDYGKYGQYDDGNYLLPGSQRTAAFDLENKRIDSNERMHTYSTDSNERLGLDANATQRYINNANNILAKYQIDTNHAYNMAGLNQNYDLAMMQMSNPTSNLTFEQAESALKNGVLTDAVLKAYNTGVGGSYTTSNPPPVYKTPSQIQQSSVKSSAVDDLAKSLNNTYESKYGITALTQKANGTYSVKDSAVESVIMATLDSPYLTDDQKYATLTQGFNIPSSRIENILKVQKSREMNKNG